MADNQPEERYVIDQAVRDRIIAVGGVIAGEGDDLTVQMDQEDPMDIDEYIQNVLPELEHAAIAQEQELAVQAQAQAIAARASGGGDGVQPVQAQAAVAGGNGCASSGYRR